MPQWPAHFPVRPPDGAWAIETVDPAIRSQPDIGPPIVRLRYSTDWEIWQGTLTLTLEEKQQLFDFWRTDCSRGTAPFTALHWEDLLTEVTLQWGTRPGPVEHVAKLYYRVGINFIRMP